MEELNHDLTQGSRLGGINERREKKKKINHTSLLIACLLHTRFLVQ